MARPRKLHPNTARLNKYLAETRNGANQRGILWDLTSEQFLELIAGDCFYCGAAPRKLPPRHRTHNDSTAAANGLDRLDNDLGYCPLNAVPCCPTCNGMKSNRLAHDFIAASIRIAGRFASLYKENKHAFN